MTGRINDPKSRGCIDMIIEGAIPFTSVENIFRDKSVFLNAKEFCTLNNCKDSIEYDIKSLNYEKKKSILFRFLNSFNIYNFLASDHILCFTLLY